MSKQKLKWHTRLILALAVSSILFLMIWIFSQFKEPPRFNLLMNTLLVCMAFVCLESIRSTKRVVLQKAFKGMEYLKNIVAFVIPVLIGTMVYSVLFYFFKWFDHFFLGSEPPLIPHMVSAILVGLVLSLIFGLILWVVTWKDSYYQAHIKNEAYRTEMIKANLQTLRNQMSPHFLFNNFNTIYYLIDENPNEAKNFLKNVSNIYRHILNHSNKNLVEATEEYGIMLQHLAVLKERFGNALKIENKVVQQHLVEKHIPPLVLYELVENVMKHNRIDTENHIVLEIASTPDTLQLSNNRNQKKGVNSTKKGLQNIISRYELLTETKVLIEKDEDCFKAKIPLLVVSNEG